MGTNNDLTSSISQADTLTEMETDAIGEVLNISMGAAATAVSTMLDKQVVITTPRVRVETLDKIDCGTLEPAILVKITYTEGITGSNVMVFRQKDMQMILNQLMGIDEPPSDDFVFDELSMSAACEVMNQMMGASATALSKFLGKAINISTPTAMIMEGKGGFIKAVGLDADTNIVSVLFKLDIAGVINSEFVSVLTCDLAKLIISEFLSQEEEITQQAAAKHAAKTPPPAASPKQSPTAAKPMSAPAAAQQNAPPMQQAMPPVQQNIPPMQPPIPQQMQQGMPPMQQQGMPPMQQQGMPPMQQPYYPYPPQGYPAYNPYGYPPVYQQPEMSQQQVNVKPVQFPEFTQAPMSGDPVMGGNMNLIMNVPLSVSIEIGKTKRKIKDIMNFTQGTVIELEKQAGAPVDIIVNGQLLAHGDVVVIDDNFGVRITEIVGTKELLHSLEEQLK